MPPAEKMSISQPSASSVLRRRKPCVNCRSRRIKCDGEKPVCGPCSQDLGDRECEYDGPPVRSKTQALEDSIARLEARLSELENTNEQSQSPLSTSYRSRRMSQSAPDWPLYNFSPVPRSHSSPFGSSRGSSASSRRASSSRGQISPGIPESEDSFIGAEEPSLLVIQNLLDNFIPHASQFGFFLDTSRFRDLVLLPHPFDHPSRPAPALLSTVYLWGVHLSHSEPLVSYHHVFLSRALKHAATDLANLSARPQKVLHTIQAQVLLANYFFRNGQFLEAKCHSGIAVSIALGCGLHKIRSSLPVSQPTIGVLLNMTMVLPQPQDAIEEGERINGFWAVFILHRTLAVALDSPTHLCGALEAPGVQIDTPWPLNMESYQQEPLPPDLRGSATVRAFLTNSAGNPEGGLSTLGAIVRGAILFHRTAHFAGQWTPDMKPEDLQAFSAAFSSLDRLIDRFRDSLPLLRHFDATTHSETRTIVLAHALAEASVIKLHANFVADQPSSKQKSLAAARAIVGIGGINIRDFGCVNPLMGTLWGTACQVFIDEILRIKAHQSAWVPTPFIGDERELMASLRDGMAAMTMFADSSPLMKYQLTEIQERYATM